MVWASAYLHQLSLPQNRHRWMLYSQGICVTAKEPWTQGIYCFYSKQGRLYLICPGHEFHKQPWELAHIKEQWGNFLSWQPQQNTLGAQEDPKKLSLPSRVGTELGMGRELEQAVAWGSSAHANTFWWGALGSPRILSSNLALEAAGRSRCWGHLVDSLAWSQVRKNLKMCDLWLRLYSFPRFHRSEGHASPGVYLYCYHK